MRQFFNTVMTTLAYIATAVVTFWPIVWVINQIT